MSCEHEAELWLLPAAFDFAEDNWRAIHITFYRTARDDEAVRELDDLARTFDGLGDDLEWPYEQQHLGNCVVRFEMDVTAETAALLLYLAANLVRSGGIPTDSAVVVLSDPTGICGKPRVVSGNS